MDGLKDKLDQTYLGGPNSLIKNNNNMDGLKDKLDQTYLDGSPERYGSFAQKYDASTTYLNSPEGTIRGQGGLLGKFNQTNFDLENPEVLGGPLNTPYVAKIGANVMSFPSSTPYGPKNTYADQFRTQEQDKIYLGRILDSYK